jgi:hypothetical protein
MKQMTVQKWLIIRRTEVTAMNVAVRDRSVLKDKRKSAIEEDSVSWI